MSMMSKLCSDLRSAADEGYCPNRDRILMREAADTIECLSENVRSQNLHSKSADAVEVVRCKDCKHYQNEHICMYFSRHGTIETSSYAYCAYGERKNHE